MKTPDDRRAQFEAECRTAGLTLGARDDELLYAMWLDWLPERDRLRAAVPPPEDEPGRGAAPVSPRPADARASGRARPPRAGRAAASRARTGRPDAGPA